MRGNLISPGRERGWVRLYQQMQEENEHRAKRGAGNGVVSTTTWRMNLTSSNCGLADLVLSDPPNAQILDMLDTGFQKRTELSLGVASRSIDFLSPRTLARGNSNETMPSLWTP